MKRLVHALQASRQHLYPKEYRIDAPSPILDLAPQLEDSLRLLREEVAASKVGLRQPPSHSVTTMLADVATSLWRMRLRMAEPSTGLPFEEMKRPFRHLQAALDALAEGELEVVDHTGEAVPESGDYMLRMVSFLPREELSRETVVETLKPTILYQGKLIQVGEVIVGTPKKQLGGQE